MVTTKSFMVLFIGMVLLSVIAQGVDVCCDRSEVKTLGTGQVSVNADIASIYASVITEGKTLKEAQDNVQEILNKTNEFLTQNDLQNATIQTSYFSIYPTYNYSSTSKEIIGYSVYFSLTISISGIDKDQTLLGKVIEGLAEAGVNSISTITYNVMDMQTPAVDARKAAYANALKKANQYVDITGGQLGKILKIDESGQTFYPYFTTSSSGYTTQTGLGMTITQSSKISKSSGLQLPQGQVTIIVDVVVTWVLNTK